MKRLLLVGVCVTLMHCISYAETKKLAPASSKPTKPVLQRGPTLQGIFVSIMEHSIQNGFQLKDQVDSANLMGASAKLAGLRWINGDEVQLKAEYYDVLKPITKSGLVVCNGMYQKASYPGYVINNKCSIAVNGQETFVTKYNLLTNAFDISVDWVPYANKLPALAIEGGVLGEKGARKLFICSAKPSGSAMRSLIGRYDQGTCHISFQGREITESVFDILAVKDCTTQPSTSATVTQGLIQGPAFSGNGPAVNPATGKMY